VLLYIVQPSLQIDKNISDEKMATIESLIDQSVSMMAKLWNEK